MGKMMDAHVHHWLAGVCFLGLAGVSGYLAYELLCADDRNRALQSQLSSAEADLRKERLKRQVDRTGRTRAEKQVRELQLRLAQSSTPERQRAPSGAEQGRGASTRSVDPLRELEERGYHPDREHVTMGMDESGRAQRSPTRQLKSARLRREDDQSATEVGGSQSTWSDCHRHNSFGEGSQHSTTATDSVGSALTLSQPRRGTPDVPVEAPTWAGAALAWADAPPFPMRPIAFLRSCFSQRNGTPRQPQLVPTARASLTLLSGVPVDCIEGLHLYSHCWLLYVFHENTDLQRLWASDHRQRRIKAKVSVPRLDGGRMGVLATRSPHRPCPLGLSVARIVEVHPREGRLVLGGCDLVDGSPVLDIKPYVPFCDAVANASAPDWVAPVADNEPLHVAAVVVTDAAEREIADAWQQVASSAKGSLFARATEFLSLVTEVLSRDIRSVHQRGVKGDAGLQHNDIVYEVVLDGVVVAYTMDSSRRVVVQGARVWDVAEQAVCSGGAKRVIAS